MSPLSSRLGESLDVEIQDSGAYNSFRFPWSRCSVAFKGSELNESPKDPNVDYGFIPDHPHYLLRKLSAYTSTRRR